MATYRNQCILAFTALLISLLTGLSRPGPAFSEDTYRFERMWPSLREAWYFSSPSDVAIDELKSVAYIADSNNHRIQKFTLEGELITVWGKEGEEEGEFQSPSSVAIDRDGYVYVADTNNHRIQKFTSNGRLISIWGTEGSENGQFRFPSGIAVGSDGHVYVADTFNHRIQKFTSEGIFVSTWGREGQEDGEFASPSGVALGPEGHVYVMDTGNHRMQKFSSDGFFLGKLEGRGSGDGEFSFPMGIAVDGGGRIYVADTQNERVQKFASDGTFLTEWSVSLAGYDNFSPRGIAVGVFGMVYVADTYYHTIWKFTSDGCLVTKWWNQGPGIGEFVSPYGIARDSNNHIYVADTLNHRVQKFTSEGHFLNKWGTYGAGEGHFFRPSGIAIGSDGHVYVADTFNHRIQKFTSDGLFAAVWGHGPGSGDGEFSFPAAVDVDGNGNVYVADTENHRIQKFTSEGVFLDKWGTRGTAPVEFQYPQGIAIDAAGNVLVSDTENHRIQKLTSTGEFLGEWGKELCGVDKFAPQGIGIDSDGNICVAEKWNDAIFMFNADGISLLDRLGGSGSNPGSLLFPKDVCVTSSNRVYVVESKNHRVQVFSDPGARPETKAIIVAGAGFEDNLWDSIQRTCNFAYRALTYQGYTKASICYLSPNLTLDLDNNGEPDDVDGDATLVNLENAIVEGAKDGESLVLYLSDHGGDGTYRVSPTDILYSAQLDLWLDHLQETLPGRVTVVYDACRSGSFLKDLAPPPGKDRLVAASASPDQNAYFLTQGAISFSSYFWTRVFYGSSVGEAFSVAEEALRYVTDYQQPWLDANGNTVANEAEDRDLAQSVFVGCLTAVSGDAPILDGVFENLVLPQGVSSALLYAGGVTDDDGIARVWAVIIPPDFVPEDPADIVLGLPTTELFPAGDNRYETLYDQFDMAGQYVVLIYARDRKGNTSVAEPRTVTVSAPLKRKTVIVAGGEETDPLWPCVKYNGELARRVLKSQLYTDDRIWLLSNDASMEGRNGNATLLNLQTALTTWATTDTLDLILYIVGPATREGLQINETETLKADVLRGWLDQLQTAIPGKVTVIYDADYSGSFLPALAPPEGKERIVLSSTSHREPAEFLVGGAVSFSSYFWGQVANAATVRRAFLQAKDAISHAGAGQEAHIDDNGNGIGNEKYDGVLADKTVIGAGIILAGDAPVIGAVCPAQTVTDTGPVTLWAENVTTTGILDRVWAVVTPPGYPDPPMIEIELVAVGNRYEGTFGDFPDYGDYKVTFYARDLEGSLSKPVSTSIKQESRPDIYEPDSTSFDACVLVLNKTRPQTHNFHMPGDADWTRFFGLAGQTYTIQAANADIQCDPVIQIYNGNGTTLIASRNNGGLGQPETLEWPCPADGIYSVRITHADPGAGGADTGYDLSLTQPLGTPLSGTISGRVMDNTGQEVAGARIWTDGQAAALSGPDGTYTLTDKPGTYAMTVEAPGYATQSATDIEVTYDGSTIQDFRLTDNSGAVPDIRANGSNGPVTVPAGSPVSVTVSLDPGDCNGLNADWWIAVQTPFAAPLDWYTYVHPTGWQPGVHLCIQNPLFTFSGFEVLNMVLPQGAYTFYFAVDAPDGQVTAEVLDYVVVEVE